MKTMDIKKLKPSIMVYIYPILTLLIIIPGIIYLYLQETKNVEEIVEQVEELNEETKVIEKTEKVVEIEYTIYDEQPAKEGALYFEDIIELDNQPIYFAYPLTIEANSPPTLIVYSHGSNTTVSDNLEDPFMQEMLMYGEYFTNNGYAFTASAQHGANWGSTSALNDIQNSIDYISSEYSIQPTVNLLGFSMGGLPTLFYTFENHGSVNKVALLAPTTYIWGADKMNTLLNEDIKLWHGDQDVNIGWYVSDGFVKRSKDYGIDIEFETIEGATHFDIDTELKEDILQFYNE